MEIKSFTTDFEEGLKNGFLFTFKDKINELHHYGCFFQYLQSCQRKLEILYLKKKIHKKIAVIWRSSLHTRGVRS